MRRSMMHTTASFANEKQDDKKSDMNRMQTNAALSSVIALIMFGFLLFAPQFLPSKLVTGVLGVVPAIYMTWCALRFPNSLRNGRGSQVTAICLVAFLWFVAIASVASILAGVVM